jgi:NAD(P)-dependent dehydrogenase (short-subunit alcohol dehydrogenase family)
MLKNITKTPLQKALLVIALLFSISLQFPQPKLDLEYYTALASDYTASTDKNVPLQGLNIVVTGATSGIGLDLSKKLYNLGGNIIAIGRSESKLSTLVKEVQGDAQRGRSNDDKRIVTVIADFQDMESVSAAANDIKSKFKTIDYLINNAGMTQQSLGMESATPQGYDMVFAVNYLSHFLLTEKLLPNLKRSKLKDGSRIVQVASSMHLMANGDDLVQSLSAVKPVASLPSNEYKHGYRSYGNSKLAQIYHTRSLNCELDNEKDDKISSLKVASVCPSWVATHIAGAGWKNALDVFAFQSDGFGLAPILFAMFHPDVGLKDGIYNDYVNNCSFFSEKMVSALEQLWKLTSPIPFFREATVSIGASFLLLVQKTFASVGFRSTSSDGYNVEKQDALYKWSKEAVQAWM